MKSERQKAKAVVLVSLALIGLGLSSCEVGSNNESYSYLQCFNCSDGENHCLKDQHQCGGGCTTGEHNFDSKDSYCSTLNSRSQNNDCASEGRKQMFEQAGCSGTFTNN